MPLLMRSAEIASQVFRSTLCDTCVTLASGSLPLLNISSIMPSRERRLVILSRSPVRRPEHSHICASQNRAVDNRIQSAFWLSSCLIPLELAYEQYGRSYAIQSLGQLLRLLCCNLDS